MSRIRVQFPWQKQVGEKSPWLRVVTPYAGGGKGQHILPEIGEEVLVGFENDNAEKPFVHGAIYHGEGKSGHGGEGNFIKSFQTATGIKLVMNDKEKSFLLEDPSGNTVFADGKGNMTLTAPNNMTITVGKNLNISVGENMSTKIGANEDITISNNKTETIGKNYIQNSDNKSITVKNDKTETIGNSYKQVAGDSDIQTSKGDMKIRGTALTVVQGGKDIKVSKG
jgi:type VI secretion system secreted protein VgrG